MRVLVFGSEVNFEEAAKKIGDKASVSRHSDVHTFQDSPGGFDLILDYTFDDQPEVIEQYRSLEGPLILLNNVKSTLAELWFVSGGWKARIAGFNGLPGFVDRDLWEITSLKENDNFPELEELNIKWEQVEDRVGMVAPRVICMIINEAYYTVQEGTADRESINTAMKLGTGYPHGPFEWAAKIGIIHIYELLSALYEDTGEERYKVCPLLKKEYLLSQ